MVQLLLILNLLAILTLFVFLVNLYSLLKDLERRYEELEKDFLKEESSVAELRMRVERVNSNLTFLQRELKVVLDRLASGGSR